MDLNGQIILSYIEEDNVQRSFFRVRPLLCRKGSLTNEDIAAYPDHGYMRVVPDKNEQHTFKDRMHTLGNWCIIDLQNARPEYSKIRNNKNYAPERGEFNQFIIYSDAVKPLPANLFFEVVSENNAANAITPCVYIRNGGNITGPYFRDGGKPAAEELTQVAPDSKDLFTLVRPDEKEHLVYWPEAAKAEVENPVSAPAAERTVGTAAPAVDAAPAVEEKAAETPAVKAEVKAEEPKSAEPDAYEKIKDMDAALEVRTHLLRQSEVPAAPVEIPAEERRSLSGTPLYGASRMKQIPTRRMGNALSETVDRQRNAGRYESAGAEVSDSAQLKTVDNPADAFKQQFGDFWQIPEIREQMAQTILEANGMRSILSHMLDQGEADISRTAFKNQLHEMEAERLMQIMRMDELKANREKLLKEAYEHAELNNKKEMAALERKLAELREQHEQMEAEQKQLVARRDELVAAAGFDHDLVAAPAGTETACNEVIKRLKENLAKAGFVSDENTAIAMLLMSALNDQFVFVANREDDACRAAEAMADALGAACTRNAFARKVAGGNGYSFIISGNDDITGAGDILAERAFEEIALPQMYLKQNKSVLPEKTVRYAPVCKVCLEKELLNSETMPAQIGEIIQTLREKVQEDIPLVLLQNACAFIGSAMKIMSNGAAAAIDWAIALYILPYLKAAGTDTSVLTDYLKNMEVCVEILNI